PPAIAYNAPETIQTSEVASAEQAPAPRRLRPSEVLAEARFFSSHGRRVQQSQDQESRDWERAKWTPDTAETSPSAAPALKPPLPSAAALDIELTRALEKRAAAALAQAQEQIPEQARQPVSESIVPFHIWPPRQLSLALQGGGSFGAFTWGVLERLLEEPAC